MKKITTMALLIVTTNTAIASKETDSKFNQLIKTHKINPPNKQSYCYTDENGRLQGLNVNTKVRLASVSKLLTSLWAIEIKKVNFRYDTKLFIQNRHLHIQGSYDPFMNDEKMLYLVSQLNAQGYTHFDKITFDKNVLINPKAHKFESFVPDISQASNIKNLESYFNTSSWETGRLKDYDILASSAKSDKFLSSVTFSVDSVAYSEKVPKGSDVRELTLPAPELYKYLKKTNVESLNYPAQKIFENLGGAAAFEKFLAKKFNLDSKKIKLFTGSGLAEMKTGTRQDNYATCAIITKLISKLKDSVEKQNKFISDIVAVPGNDLGTFRSRLNSEEIKNTVNAKTGSLQHTSTIAGGMSTQSGYSFFGIFNQSEINAKINSSSAKNVQNEMVETIMAELGGSKVFGYRAEGFRSYNNFENLKSFDLFDEDADSDISVIEGDLY